MSSLNATPATHTGGTTTAAEVSSPTSSATPPPTRGYFFPPLAQQRWVYCIDQLKQQDIKSVCEPGCGTGSVIAPMLNPASHIDAFPEVRLDLIIDPEPEDAYMQDVDSPGQRPSQSLELRPQEDTETEDISSISSDDPSAVGPQEGAPTPKQIATINDSIVQQYNALPKLRGSDKELHLRRIAGVDLDLLSLEEAVRVTAPPPDAASVEGAATRGEHGNSTLHRDPEFFDFNAPRERWEDLRVELWHGSLDIYNDALDNFEAFVLTEVIEHLSPKTLHRFPDILFGTYRPRLIIVTTPNYEFNQFFRRPRPSKVAPTAACEGEASTPPSQQREEGLENPEEEEVDEGEGIDDEPDTVDSEGKHCFLDPTGRTERHFRDADHKFEWTRSEFEEWCRSITSKYEYGVEFSGVGSLTNFFGKGGMREASAVPTESERGQSKDGASSALSQLPEEIQDLCTSQCISNPSSFYATQIAIFTRKFAYESERNPRSPVQVPLAFFGSSSSPASSKSRSLAGVRAGDRNRSSSSSDSNLKSPPLSSGSSTMSISQSKSPLSAPTAAKEMLGTSLPLSPANLQHKLLKTHYYPASPASGNARPLSEIRALLEETMRNRMRMGSCSIRELWGRSNIAKSCGGYINKIIEAVAVEHRLAVSAPMDEELEANDARAEFRRSQDIWDIAFHPEVLERGNQIEDATYLVLKDFVEPPWEYGEDDDEDGEEERGSQEEDYDDDDDHVPSNGYTAADIAKKASRMRIVGDASNSKPPKPTEKKAAKLQETEPLSFDVDPDFEPWSIPANTHEGMAAATETDSEWLHWGAGQASRPGEVEGTPPSISERDANTTPGWE